MITKNYVLSAINGLSSRLSSQLVSEANKFDSDIMLVYQDEFANLKSIMNIMALVIRKGESFSIQASGEDENEAIQSLENLMLNNRLIEKI